MTVLAVSAGTLVWEGTHRQTPLHQVTAARDASGRVVAVTEAAWEADPSLPFPTAGPRELALAIGVQAARETDDALWLDAGLVPSSPTGRRALLDLRTLTSPGDATPGSVLAGPSPAWRFVWPRDASFVAVAYARTGHPHDALVVLGRLAALQAVDGSLQARYLPTEPAAVPDDRPRQEDGPGWVLWAVRQTLAVDPDAAPELAPLATRAAARLLARLDPATLLPLPSPDYWERPEDRLTLGVAATSLMGLEAAAALAASDSIPAEAWRTAGVDPTAIAPRAALLRSRIVREFGPDFGRYADGRPDAAVTFLLPPFVDAPVPGAASARLRGQSAMLRPAGGVAPGASWRRDGVSWTPQTALQALAARAGGRDREAGRWLAWLAAHRTSAGSLPEKVTYDGAPAAVAPLAWTAALVVLADPQVDWRP